MKKTILAFLAGATLLASCAQSNEYVIHGTVTNMDLEGAKIFLVPLENFSLETLDSTYVHNQTFEFRGTEERMADIRIERLKRIGTETLLVVTEPGETHVTIGQVSSGRGTPQNDSLQVWKNLTKDYYQKAASLNRQDRKEEAAALRESYAARSRQMASNVGEESTLGIFLNSRFPENN